MTTMNSSLRCVPIIFSATSRWPVEETGMNSVMPSTMPRMRLMSQSGMNHLTAKRLARARRKFIEAHPHRHPHPRFHVFIEDDDEDEDDSYLFLAPKRLVLFRELLDL